jgi:hypothetical protein
MLDINWQQTTPTRIETIENNPGPASPLPDRSVRFKLKRVSAPRVGSAISFGLNVPPINGVQGSGIGDLECGVSFSRLERDRRGIDLPLGSWEDTAGEDN